MDSHCEWVKVSPNTYQQYIDHYGNKASTMPMLRDDESDAGSAFDEDSDEFEEPVTSCRRLDYGYVAGGISKTMAASSPHRVTATRPFQPHPNFAPTRFLQCNTSVTSSLSLSTLESPSPFATPDSKRSSPSSRRRGDSLSTSPKYSQKLWTPEEDRLLMSAVSGHNEANLKWSLVARAVPGRSGKQCRERYLNHLTPNLKLKNWSPVEDATIFRLHHTDGSKWSMMSKFIRGRTDNGIKNRYHHLKRRLERQMHLLPESDELLRAMAHLQEKPQLGQYEDFLIKCAASEILQPISALDESAAEGFLRVALDEKCNRCGMLVPSKQTGRLVCKTTGWCELCVRVSPCISGDLLRAIGEARCQLDFEAPRE